MNQNVCFFVLCSCMIMQIDVAASKSQSKEESKLQSESKAEAQLSHYDQYRFIDRLSLCPSDSLAEAILDEEADRKPLSQSFVQYKQSRKDISFSAK